MKIKKILTLIPSVGLITLSTISLASCQKKEEEVFITYDGNGGLVYGYGGSYAIKGKKWSEVDHPIVGAVQGKAFDHWAIGNEQGEVVTDETVINNDVTFVAVYRDLQQSEIHSAMEADTNVQQGLGGNCVIPSSCYPQSQLTTTELKYCHEYEFKINCQTFNQIKWFWIVRHTTGNNGELIMLRRDAIILEVKHDDTTLVEGVDYKLDIWQGVSNRYLELINDPFTSGYLTIKIKMNVNYNCIPCFQINE